MSLTGCAAGTLEPAPELPFRPAEASTSWEGAPEAFSNTADAATSEAAMSAMRGDDQEPQRDPHERECAQGGTDLLIVGTYHMDNPGLDAINLESDDVLAAHRQVELTALNAALARFRPTKVAVEGDRSRSTWPDR